MLVAGVLSGTSVDAIDVALVEIRGKALGQTVRIVGFHEFAFPAGVRAEVFGVSNRATTTARLSQVNFLLGQLFGEAVLEACNRSGVNPEEVDLVGSHGQTVYHQADFSELCGRNVASTLQIGEPACIAYIVGAPVVADFRTGDLAAGGQGAPLVPYVDFLLFRHEARNRVVLNLGGIANLTAIPAAATPGDVFAFDTGPGNMVSDLLVESLSGGAERFDRDGRRALKGSADEALVAELLGDPYFAEQPPKSTGRERFGPEFAASLLGRGLSPEAAVATAVRLTVRSILLGVERFVRSRMAVHEVIVSGGGWRNPAISRPLREGLAEARVRSSAALGVPEDAKEAVAFAVLAYEAYHGRPANLPSATGASKPVVLGKIVRTAG